MFVLGLDFCFLSGFLSFSLFLSETYQLPDKKGNGCVVRRFNWQTHKRTTKGSLVKENKPTKKKRVRIS